MDVSSPVLITAIAGIFALLLVAAFVVYNRRVSRFRQGMRHQQSVDETLLEAIDSRSVFNVRFSIPEMKDRYLRGPCVALGADKILVDVNLSYAVPGWVGLPVHIYFTHTLNKSTVFYEFSTTIARTVPYLGNVALELYIPNKLTEVQRRTFVRFSPPNRFVGSIRLWTGRIVRYVEGLQPKTAPPSMLQGDALTIDNISAGGVRLVFSPHVYDRATINRDEPVLLSLILRNGDGSENLVLWLVTTIVQELREKDRIFLSLKFERWAPEGDADASLSWFPVGREGGVSPLAAWVMRRQLEVQCRSS